MLDRKNPKGSSKLSCSAKERAFRANRVAIPYLVVSRSGLAGWQEQNGDFQHRGRARSDLVLEIEREATSSVCHHAMTIRIEYTSRF